MIMVTKAAKLSQRKRLTEQEPVSSMQHQLLLFPFFPFLLFAVLLPKSIYNKLINILEHHRP